MITNEEWKKAQEFESCWWGDCTNTYGEEEKQFFYAKKMGLRKEIKEGKHQFDLEEKSILDIGGGPNSLLLKCINKHRSVVVEPMDLPNWVWIRYNEANISRIQQKGEDYRFCSCGTGDVLYCEKFDIEPGEFDEVWIYNVLQHTQDPEKIIGNARQLGKVIRIFEWLDTPAHEGHPQTLREAELNTWLHGKGRVEQLEKDTFGYKRAYYGIFPTDNYGKVDIQ